MNLVEKPNPKDGWYEIDPMEAGRLLENGHPNRAIRESRVIEIADQIRNGKYTRNGECLVLDADGKLLDGQHRCRAVQMVGKSIVTYIVHLPKTTASVFDSFDQGSARNGADRILELGAKNCALQAAIIKLVIQYERTSSDPTQRVPRVTPGDIRMRRSKDPLEFERSASYLNGHKKHLHGMVPISHVGFVHYIGSKRDVAVADAFVEALTNGAELPASSPVLLLRNRLILENQTGKRSGRRENIALLIKAWNLYASGRTAKQLKFESRESFPDFEVV